MAYARMDLYLHRQHGSTPHQSLSLSLQSQFSSLRVFYAIFLVLFATKARQLQPLFFCSCCFASDRKTRANFAQFRDHYLTIALGTGRNKSSTVLDQQSDRCSKKKRNVITIGKHSSLQYIRRLLLLQ